MSLAADGSWLESTNTAMAPAGCGFAHRSNLAVLASDVPDGGVLEVSMHSEHAARSVPLTNANLKSTTRVGCVSKRAHDTEKRKANVLCGE